MDFKQTLADYEAAILNISNIKEAAGAPRKLKSTITSKLAGSLSRLPDVKKVIDLRSTPTGTVAFVRTNDGDAYEIEIRPSYKGKYFQDKRGVTEDKTAPVSRKNIMLRGANLVFSFVEGEISKIARRYNTTFSRVVETAEQSITRLIKRSIESKLVNSGLVVDEKEWVFKEVCRLIYGAAKQ